MKSCAKTVVVEQASEGAPSIGKSITDLGIVTPLYEAAQVMLTRVQKWSWLKAWAMNIAKRRAQKKSSSHWHDGSPLPMALRAQGPAAEEHALRLFRPVDLRRHVGDYPSWHCHVASGLAVSDLQP